MRQLRLTQPEFDTAYLFPFQNFVCYHPQIYPAVAGSQLRVFATDATPKFPSIYIAYTFDDEKVHLWYAELKAADGQES